jgi:phosphatidylserine/phosphatidylglycerophosphate/cardiolipin synthase-like enzyme
MYVRDESTPRSALTNTQTENQDPFIAGRLGMMISHPSEYAVMLDKAKRATGEDRKIADAVVANMRYGLIPKGPVRRAVVFGGWNFHIFNPNIVGGGLDLDAAMALAAFMTGPEWSVKLAWTGPGTDAVPLRRVDQVLYELVESAESEVLLATYAAYKAQRALDVLRAATERGVQVVLVIELAQQSGGKITFDRLDSIRESVPRANVFYWPLGRRPRTAVGSYGTMHVKCLIADRETALVSSAEMETAAPASGTSSA